MGDSNISNNDDWNSDDTKKRHFNKGFIIYLVAVSTSIHIYYQFST